MRVGRFNKALSLWLIGILFATLFLTFMVLPVSAADPADQEYIYVSSMGNLEFFNAHKFGWRWGGEVLGVKTSYVGPAEYDMSAMVSAFDTGDCDETRGHLRLRCRAGADSIDQ